jgi:hypothetical protein
MSALAIEAMMEAQSRERWEKTGNRITAQGPIELNKRVRADAAIFKEIFDTLNIKVD